MARRRRSVTAVTTPFDSCIAAMWAKANTVHLGGTGLLAWPPGLSLCHAERARPPPIFPSAHQPRHHRILLDIANDLGQLFRPPHRSYDSSCQNGRPVLRRSPNPSASATTCATRSSISSKWSHRGPVAAPSRRRSTGDEDFARRVVLQDLHGSWRSEE